MTPRQLSEIHAACFTLPRPWSEAEFTDLLRSRNIYLCEHAAGFALGRVAGPEAELLTLAVLPERQGQGIGRALLRDFEAEALRRGAEEAFLEVAVGNAAAIHLYRSDSFEESAIRKDYYDGPKGAKVSCLVMRKDLSPT